MYAFSFRNSTKTVFPSHFSLAQTMSTPFEGGRCWNTRRERFGIWKDGIYKTYQHTNAIANTIGITDDLNGWQSYRKKWIHTRADRPSASRGCPRNGKSHFEQLFCHVFWTIPHASSVFIQFSFNWIKFQNLKCMMKANFSLARALPPIDHHKIGFSKMYVCVYGF